MWFKKEKYTKVRPITEDMKVPEGIWTKCKRCEKMFQEEEIKSNHYVCLNCGFHQRLSAFQRLSCTADPESFHEMFQEVESTDFLEFEDTRKYAERLLTLRKKNKSQSAILTGVATIKGLEIAVGIMDFSYMGGSMGCAVGEKICRLVEHASEAGLPLVIFSCSGGARMQEGIMSLMQMAKTSSSISRFQNDGGLYISVMTDPTTGGTTASFASLGDLIIAEPGALIGFAGPRVIEQTIRQHLPEGFQRSEFLLEHGFLDELIQRKDIPERISQYVRFFVKKKQLHTMTSA